jgi:predicted ArsR family transcriptional regulator
MAVRQHLQKLADEELVDYEEERRSVGRPARRWRLAAAAAQRFPDTHADLTVDILASVQRTFGKGGLTRVISDRTRQQERTYRARLPGRGAPLHERVNALAEVRREEGYMAEVSRRADGSLLLVENHCPICAAARFCQGLCADELGLFRRLLGRGVRVERSEHLLAGARRCAYEIRSRT